jgi:hypothetical protein
MNMSPGYFVIAILGCADGSTECIPVATIPTHYASETVCSAEVSAALAANSDFDFPTLVAECRPVAAPAAAKDQRMQPVPALVLRG